MELDHETRTVLLEKLQLSKGQIDKYEKGQLTLSGYDEYKLRSGKLSRKISREMTEKISNLLDICNIFGANEHMLDMAHEIGEQYKKRNLTLDDNADLMTKLHEYNIASNMVCECKNKVPRTELSYEQKLPSINKVYSDRILRKIQ